MYTWDEPEYYGGEQLVYLIKDEDGSILAATKTRQLIVTDTHKTDPPLTISAVGDDGRAEPTSSTSENVVVYDLRTEEITDSPTSNPEPQATNNGHVVTPQLTMARPITQGTYPLTSNSLYTDPTNDGDIFGTVLGSTNLQNAAQPKQTLSHPDIMNVAKGSNLTIWAIPLSIAVALGILITARVFIRLK